MIAALPDDMACREYLENTIWDGVPTCPHCQSKRFYVLKTKGVFKGMYKCKDCQKRYTVTMGTMFESTHIPLRKWFIAIYIFAIHKKGISSHQLASDLGITQKSAWFMLGRIRHSFKDSMMRDIDGITYEIDATYIGAKAKNKHAKQRRLLAKKFGRGTGNKIAVLGILERDGNVVTSIVKSEAASEVEPIISETIGDDATVITDAHSGYKDLNDECNHIVVNHQEGEYVKGRFHTNNIEGFWSHMKRGIYGIYHHVSPQHLHRYCDEFSFRYNLRKKTVLEKFNFPLQHSQRITDARLIAKPQ